MFKFRATLILGIILPTLLLTACEPYAKRNQSTSEIEVEYSQDIREGFEPPRTTEEKLLVEAAQAEGGELTIYTSMNIEDLEEILTIFRERYPFTKTDYYRAAGDDVIQKIMTEDHAGKHFADVIETEAFEVYRLMQAGLLQPYVAPQSSAYPDSLKDPAGYWTVDRLNTVVIGYNTELVSQADVPTTWEDLLDPKWKGKIAVEVNDIELLADMVRYWGKEKTYAFWGGIAAQEPGIVDGHTELAEFVSAGEFAISPTLYGYRVEKLKADGAPIEWVRTDPVFAYTQLLAMASNAPNQATAQLFINWLLSEEGQFVYRKVGRIPSRPGIGTDPPGLIEGLNLVYSVPSLAADYDSYASKWRSFLALE
jgi:iron(III) transport system substrate-binding protein